VTDAGSEYPVARPNQPRGHASLTTRSPGGKGVVEVITRTFSRT